MCSSDLIDGDYDENKKSATVTVTIEMSRWTAPPGSVVALKNMGVWNGRWLVNDVTRSLFSRTGTITLKKPMPVLPEPSTSNIVSTSTTASTQSWTGSTTPDPTNDPSQRTQYKAVDLVQPIPAGYHTHIVQGYHQTLNLPGYPAYDFGGDAGAPVIAVESGKLVRYSGNDPSEGPPLGPGGPFAWSIYLLGDSGTEYYYTHLATRRFPDPANGVQTKVQSGEVIGTVADWMKASGGVTPDHVHLGVHPGPTGRPDIYDIANAPQAQA